MKKIKNMALIGAVALVVVAVAQPALAICPNARLVTTIDPISGETSYIYSPAAPCTGSTYVCDTNPFQSSVTPGMSGIFWLIGDGNPDPALGNDNGTFELLVGSGGSYTDGWGYSIADGYPAFFDSAWSADPGINGCADTGVPLDPANRCTGVVLNDQDDAGNSYYALLTKREDLGNYIFVQPGEAPIVLAELPKPGIVDSVKIAVGQVQLTLQGPDISPTAPGLYLDSNCPFSIIGYRNYVQTTGRDGSAPVDRNRALWAPLGPVTTDAQTDVQVTCSGEEDVYVTSSIVFDSGFETLYVGANATRVECGPNLAHPEKRVKPRPRPGEGLDRPTRGKTRGRGR